MRKSLTTSLVALGLVVPSVASTERLTTRSLNMYGLPSGLIDMPTAEVAPDAQLSTTVSHFGGTTKTSLSFQLTPRLTGTFRYSAIRGFKNVPSYALSAYYDRSFDLHYSLLKEGKYRPAVAVGLRDLLGTGLYGGEYVVATKSLGNKLRLTGGLGWGRLGSHNSFASTGTRPTTLLGGGGLPNVDKWFRGPVAAFGGLSYQHNDKLSFAVEYSSDAYTRETTQNVFSHKSPWNFGLKYNFNNNVQVGANYMYGSELGVYVSVALNAKSSPVVGGNDTAPVAVALRSMKDRGDLGWTLDQTAKPQIRQGVAKALARDGIVLEAMRLDANSAEILIRSDKFDIESQTTGRSMRRLSRALPPSVETLTVTHSNNGMPAGSVTVKRSDLENLENASADAILQRAKFSGGSDVRNLEQLDGTYPRLSWQFGPSLQLSVFDPDSPVRADLLLNLEGDYHIAPGWVASGALTYKLGGNLDGLSPNRSGVVAVDPAHAVRSDARKYAVGAGPKIDHLTIAKFGRHGDNLYSRVTFGYLEQMYAGVSGELLWKPVNSRLAIGAEVNYVAQRNFDQRFGLQDYKVATGHVSAYYDLGNGFHTQVDVGRYLAGDFGATLSLDREFGNGWRVGAYATKTTLSTASFGEGSFDKGIRITMPMSWALGNATKRSTKTTIQSLARDGGARLNVDGRLYESIRETHGADMAKTWGKFWR